MPLGVGDMGRFKETVTEKGAEGGFRTNGWRLGCCFEEQGGGRQKMFDNHWGKYSYCPVICLDWI